MVRVVPLENSGYIKSSVEKLACHFSRKTLPSILQHGRQVSGPENDRETMLRFFAKMVHTSERARVACERVQVFGFSPGKLSVSSSMI